MVSNRCKYIVETELNKLGLKVLNIELGYVELDGVLTEEQRDRVEESLQKTKLSLMEDKKRVLVQKIKQLIYDVLHDDQEIQEIKFSAYLSDKLCMNYTNISNIFSEVTNTTIEQYIIKERIKRVKELIFQNELNLTQISYLLSYSSVAHLSNQFKKVTGMSPTQFKKKMFSEYSMRNQLVTNQA